MRCRLWKGDLSNSRKKHKVFVSRKAAQLARRRRDRAAAERLWKAKKASLEAELSAVKRELAELRRAIGEVFTDTQVSRLQSKGKKQWPEEDIARALSIRCVSHRCYRYLPEGQASSPFAWAHDASHLVTGISDSTRTDGLLAEDHAQCPGRILTLLQRGSHRPGG